MDSAGRLIPFRGTDARGGTDDRVTGAATQNRGQDGEGVFLVGVEEELSLR